MDAGRSSSAGACETFMFADLCAFCEYTVRNGDEAAADLALAFHALVRALAADHGCEVVKSLGDAVMVRSSDCRRMARLAHSVLRDASQLGQPLVRIGLDRGPALLRDGDWYGTTVNSAARLADAAEPGEVLLSERARRALADTTNIELVARGSRELKGLPVSLVHAAIAT